MSNAQSPRLPCGFVPATLLVLVAAMIPRLCSTAALAEDKIASSVRRVIVRDADNVLHAGVLESLDPMAVKLEGKPASAYSTADLISLEFPDREMVFPGTSPMVLLANGDVLVVVPERFNEESISGRWLRYKGWPAVELPLETVRGVIIDPPLTDAARVRLVDRLTGRTEPQDLVALGNGDTVTGQIVEFDGKKLVLKTALGDTSIDVAGVRAVAFNPELTSLPPLAGPAAIVMLSDFSHLQVTDVKLLPDDKLRVHAHFGAELTMPLSSVVSIRFLGGRATYLSNLSPADYKFQSFTGLTWPYRNDRTVSGGPLRLRGVEYSKGVGLHSQSDVTYALDGKFRRFQATIGIDDETGGKGSVVFEVLRDGTVIYTSPQITGTSTPVFVGPLDIAGAKQLTLRVGFGSQGDILDHADWCDALIVK